MYPFDTQNQLTQLLAQQIAQPTLNQPMLTQEVHSPKVNGRPGAEAFKMPANSDAILVDSTGPFIWFANTDSAGYKSLKRFRISESEETNPEDVYKSLEERISKLEEKLNGKSDLTNAKQRKSAE
jgi:hypothetical protein